MSWTDIVKDNPWFVPVFGAVAIGVAFVTAGPIWGFFNLYLFAFMALVAYSHSRAARKNADWETPSRSPDRPGDAAQAANGSVGEADDWSWRTGSELTHPLDLVPEMADSASSDTIPPEAPHPRGFKPVRRPILDAMVASTQDDPAGVRRALRSWVRQATSPDNQREREAQLHYWLYRAGEAGELDKLKTLAADNPKLTEVSLYLHLALQQYDELWS